MTYPVDVRHLPDHHIIDRIAFDYSKNGHEDIYRGLAALATHFGKDRALELIWAINTPEGMREFLSQFTESLELATSTQLNFEGAVAQLEV